MTRQFDLIDALEIIEFIVSVRNYEETIDQTTLQNTVQDAVSSIQEHLIKQDEKINKILEILGEEK